MFRPAGFIRDNGGGGWAGIRLNYNTFMAPDVRLDWAGLEARTRVYDFIALQERKDVESSLTQLIKFYEGEAERTLHLFQPKGANPAEQLFSKDGKIQGSLVDMSDFLHLENVTYMLQSEQLGYMGGGGYVVREPRTNPLYSERRKEHAAVMRGRHTAFDLLGELGELYQTPTTSANESRSHKPSETRTFRKKKARIEPENEVPVPKMVAVRRIADTPFQFEWLVDQDCNDRATGRVWKPSRKVDEELVWDYLQSAHLHSRFRHVDSKRLSAGTLTHVRYMTGTTVGQATLLAKLFLQEGGRMKVIQVGQPTVFDGKVKDRAYVLASRGEPKRVVFGHEAGNQGSTSIVPITDTID
ncbi:hypothetical protein CYMTET_17142 [Cymbomonas tetramitiformis]|uniref:Uncharacterized protein n=1 Tax=Cymbomonas tetramitiformis TaxID=36881 RepID=A0AAE0L7J2_9CHLO|nr:hypothetical protein CYMTET_17142 [Cymbomonas tetramitiformis]